MDTAASIIPLVISGLALAVSLGALVFNLRLARRHLFLSMHERLIAPELQEGRRLLHAKVNSVDDVQDLESSSRDEYDLVLRAVAMLDVFGMYVERRYIPKRAALDEWGYSYARAAEHAAHVVEYRADQQGGWRPWPHLRTFGATAATWVERKRAAQVLPVAPPVAEGGP